VFRVQLPRSGTAETSTQSALSADGDPDVSSEVDDFAGRLVLVVDDDAATRELMSVMLTQRGARVLTAASAHEAMALIDIEVPALIVADVGMPEEDGLTMFRKLRRRSAERGGRVPGVALSAYTRAEDRAAALAAGFDAFVAKPAVPAVLLATIQDALRGLPGDAS